MKKEKLIVQNCEITGLSHTGRGITRINNKVVFVEDAVPGDIADIEIYRNKKDYAEAKIHQLTHPSDIRTTAECNHFGICGGCRLMNLPYHFQLQYKENLVVEDFKRISHLSDFKINPIRGAEKIYHYRNKVEFTFSTIPWLTKSDEIADNPKQVLGFHVRGRYDKVVDIEKCFIQENKGNAIRNTIRELAVKYQFDFYNQKKNTGFIRTLMLRNTQDGETMVILVFTQDEKEIISAFLTEIIEIQGNIDSLYYFINPKLNDSLYDLEPFLFFGKKYITEKTGHIELKVGPKSFLQTNSYQTEVLYEHVKKFCDLKGNETIYDLYCGVGSIGLFLADSCRKVIGIEAVPESVEEAHQNMLLNNISNATFLCGLAEKEITQEFTQKYGQPDIIIVDPPRAGMHADLIKTISTMLPEKLIYVSCNPSTQARDVALLSDDFKLIEIQPVDMFPHTLHVENIALLKRK